MTFRKPTIADLPDIYEIIIQWNKPPYADELFALIKSELSQKLEYNRQFFVLADACKIIGFGGIADLIPQMLEFATKSKPGSIKSLYLNNAERGKGAGKYLLECLENKLQTQGYDEILLRSAKEYESTAWGFYIKMGYERVGSMPSTDGNGEMAVFSKMLF